MQDTIIQFTLGFFTSTIGFVVYYFTIKSGRILRFISRTTKDQSNVNIVFFQRFTGFLIFGLVPLFFLLLFRKGETTFTSFDVFSFSRNFVGGVILLISLMLIVNYLNSRTPENLKVYPQIRVSNWNPSLLFISALSWMGYLLAYEFLFRGLMLFPAVELIGFWPAIVLNTGVYMLVHLPKGMKEIIGALPFGIVLCLISLHSGSFWMAFFVHSLLALSNEWFSIYHHHDMRMRFGNGVVEEFKAGNV